MPMAGVEPARLLGTAPSRQRVYQFHHIGTYCWKTWSVPLFIRVWMGDPFRARPRGYWRDRTEALQPVAQAPSSQLY